MNNNFELLTKKIISIEESTQVCLQYMNNVNTTGQNSNKSENNNTVSYNTWHEFKLRESKANNLMIFDLPEDPKLNQDELLSVKSSEYDSKFVNKVLQSIKIKTQIDSSRIYRVGKKFPRPIVLKMIDRQDVVSFITSKNKPSDVKFSFDQTTLQRSEYKKLRLRADALNKNSSDSNVINIVKYKKGDPVIIQIKKKSVISNKNADKTVNKNLLSIPPRNITTSASDDEMFEDASSTPSIQKN